jgi:hypothetical protein
MAIEDTMNSPRKVARVAGFLYLIVWLTVLFGSLRFTLIVTGDAIATAEKINASVWLFRVGTVGDLIHITSLLLLAWALYILFKPVNRDIALLFLLIVSVSVAVQSVNLLIQFSSLRALSDAAYSTVFDTNQLDAELKFVQNTFENGTHVAQVFFGLWLLPLGYVAYKSGYLPRIIGILLMIGSVGYLVDVLIFYLLPEHSVFSIPGLLIATIAEFALPAWLLVRGVSVKQPAAVKLTVD